MSYYRLKALENDSYYPLDNGFHTLGRDPECGIAIDDQQLSRHHCVLEVGDDGITLRDLGSTNGTRVNGDRVHASVQLKRGDIIKIGKTVLLLELQLPDQTITLDPAALEQGEPLAVVDEISFTDGQGNTYPLNVCSAHSEFFLGRSEDCDLYLYEVGVSAKHAKLSYHNGSWRLDDCASRNGTFVNGKAAAGTLLQDGDKISLGKANLTVSLPTPQQAKKRRRWWRPLKTVVGGS